VFCNQVYVFLDVALRHASLRCKKAARVNAPIM
jgi:hypothetical protein